MKKQPTIQSYILVCSLIALAGLGCSLAGQAALALPERPTQDSSRAAETTQEPLYLLDPPTDTPEAVLIGLDEPTPENEPTPTAALATPEDQGMLTSPYLYYVQAGDTLPVVAVRFGVKPE